MTDLFASKLTRREALALGALAGIGAALPTDLLAADQKLITKAIPSTGEKMPVIGVGTNSFRDAELETLQPMLKRMSELGGKFIDTAAMYGESEATIGKALANLGMREKFFIATKFTNGKMMMGPPPGGAGGIPQGGMPPGGPPGGGFPGGPPGSGGSGQGGMPPGMPRMDNVGGKESFERSLERLKVGHVDLLMVHSLMGTDELMPMAMEWKKAGKVRYIGASTSNDSQHKEMTEVMKKYPLDFVQVNYSIENRAAEESVLPTALERKIAIIVNTPFGGRGGRTLNLATGRELPKWALDAGIQSWGQFLLKYVVSHPAVTVAIPGSTKVKHLEDNQAAGHGVLPDAAMRKRMEQFWAGKA